MTVLISNTLIIDMVNNVNDCINELNLIFKYEKIYKKDDYLNWGWTEQEINIKFKNNS